MDQKTVLTGEKTKQKNKTQRTPVEYFPGEVIRTFPFKEEEENKLALKASEMPL